MSSMPVATPGNARSDDHLENGTQNSQILPMDRYVQMRIIVADHYSRARKALVALLNEQPGVNLIGEVTESNGLLELARRQPVDVIMLDYGLPAIQMEELIDRIQTLNKPPIVIVMSSNPENARLALNAGADIFISKSDQPEWLLAVLHRCEKGIEEDSSR